jgi:hypothetical protein
MCKLVCSILLLAQAATQVTLAAPKDVTAMMSESQSLREAAEKEKTPDKRIKKLKEFERNLKATIKAYEKDSPTEGGDAEEKVVKFSYRFEPVFELAGKKITEAECEKAKGRIEHEDKSGRPEDATLSANAEEALKWLAAICGSHHI